MQSFEIEIEMSFEETERRTGRPRGKKFIAVCLFLITAFVLLFVIVYVFRQFTTETTRTITTTSTMDTITTTMEIITSTTMDTPSEQTTCADSDCIQNTIVPKNIN